MTSPPEAVSWSTAIGVFVPTPRLIATLGGTQPTRLNNATQSPPLRLAILSGVERHVLDRRALPLHASHRGLLVVEGPAPPPRGQEPLAGPEHSQDGGEPIRQRVNGRLQHGQHHHAHDGERTEHHLAVLHIRELPTWFL
eukprot:6523572-Pyramimonas_sp.AAC.3